MLFIRRGKTNNTVIKIDKFFQYEYEEEWFNDPLVKEMVKDIDKSEVVNSHKIVSSVLGDITPLELSGGVKALILMYKEPEYEYWATACGDNCAKWIKKFGDETDLTISLNHFMDFGDNHFLCRDAETGEEVDYFKFMLLGNYNRDSVKEE